MVEQAERVGKEKPNNPNLLYCDRIGSAVHALIGMGLKGKGELRVIEKNDGRKVDNRLFRQHSIGVLMTPSPKVDFTRAVKFELVPKSSKFKEGEKIIVNGCLIAGIDEQERVVSVGFTTHVIPATAEYGGILYAVQREGAKPVQWAEGTPNPLSIKEQKRIAKAVGLPLF